MLLRPFVLITRASTTVPPETSGVRRAMAVTSTVRRGLPGQGTRTAYRGTISEPLRYQLKQKRVEVEALPSYLPAINPSASAAMPISADTTNWTKPERRVRTCLLSDGRASPYSSKMARSFLNKSEH